MANKKFNIPIEIPIIENTESILTDSDHVVIYAKPDGKIYKKTADGVETLAVLPDYFSVETTQDFNNIPESVLRDGMFVYVVEEQTDYRRVNGVWDLNSIKYNQSSCDWAAHWYIEPLTGNDLTGDGTELNPWKTLSGALQRIPSVMIGGTAQRFIWVGEGQIEIDEKVKYLLARFQFDAPVRILGKLDLVTTAYTTVGGTLNPNNPFNRTLATGQQFDFENQYYKYYARGIHSGDYYMPIGKHGLTDVTATNFCEGYQLKDGIYESKTILHLTDGRIITMKGAQRLFFERFKITSPDTHLNLIAMELNVQFRECVFEVPVNRYVKLQGSGIEFSRCLFSFNMSGTQAVLLVQNQFSSSSGVKSSSGACLFYNEAPSNSAPLLRLTQSKFEFQMMYVNNFAYVYDCRGGVEISQILGQHPLVFENIGAVFALYGSGVVFNCGKCSGQNKMYLNNVEFLFSLIGADKNINIVLDDTYIQNNATPNNDWFTATDNKNWGSVVLSCLENKPTKLVDPARNINIVYPGSDSTIKQDWKEIEW